MKILFLGLLLVCGVAYAEEDIYKYNPVLHRIDPLREVKKVIDPVYRIFDLDID
jgi:hypothetical protein